MPVLTPHILWRCHLLLLVLLALCLDDCDTCLFNKKNKDKFINKKVKKIKSIASYIGCFRSGGEVRDLPVFAGAAGDNSPNNCNSRCDAKQKKFFALHNGNECWCGNSYGHFNKKGPDTNVNCYMPCPGNLKEKCGSESHNSVYNTTKMEETRRRRK